MKTRRRLFSKYAFLLSGLVGGFLLAGGAIEAYYSYQENKAMLLRVQREKAIAAASAIRQFFNEIESQLIWSMHSSFLSGDEGVQQRRIDFLRLLRQSPAIAQISLLDPAGKERIRASRQSRDVVGSGADYSQDPKFTQAKVKKLRVGHVYFKRQSEPYVAVSMAGPKKPASITAAEIDLTFIRDVVSRLNVGRAGRAFVVDSRNLLIAHPDMSLVLRKTDLSALPQVAAARAQAGTLGMNQIGSVARDLSGDRVFVGARGGRSHGLVGVRRAAPQRGVCAAL